MTRPSAAWKGADLDDVAPPTWDDEEAGATAPALTPAQHTPALHAWKRRTLATGAGLTLGGAVIFLYAVYIIRDRPVPGYIVGAIAVLAVAYGTLFIRFALWGPFPERLVKR